MNSDKLESLLANDKPSKVVSLLKNYKGKDARTLYLFGEAQRMLGNFDSAIALYTRANKNTKEAELKMEILLAQSSCERTLGHAEVAYYRAEAVFNMADGLQYEGYKMQALQEMGMSLRAWGRLDDSLDALNDVLAYYIHQKEYSGVNFILWAKGGIFRLQGKFTEGIKMFKDAITYAKKAGDSIGLAYSYCGLAGISRIAGDAKACVEYYKLADKIFVKSEDVFGKAYTNCGMANGLRQMGKYDEAMKRYKNADKLYSQIGDKVDLGFVKWGHAEVLKKKYRLAEAMAKLKEAEKLFANSDEKRGQILTAISISQVLYAQGKTQDAVAMYDTAVAKAKKEGLNTYLEIYT
ncbi:tetratricopeptide (TPR) repeat protein [Elusimicrobium posterum]|uniref:tetratricopeptide repeat protein n=1 Tax=Elusimicrobium posterum TaxID=3116653 RepID=UPI003C711BCC